MYVRSFLEPSTASTSGSQNLPQKCWDRQIKAKTGFEPKRTDFSLGSGSFPQTSSIIFYSKYGLYCLKRVNSPLREMLCPVYRLKKLAHRSQVIGTKTQPESSGLGFELGYSYSATPRSFRERVARLKLGARWWEPRAKPSLQPGPFICMLIPRMLFHTHTPLHLTEALSLEPCIKFGTRISLLLQLWELRAGTRALPTVSALSPMAQRRPQQGNLRVQPSSGSILRRVKDKALRPGRRVRGQSARHFVGRRAAGMLLAWGRSRALLDS